MESSRLIPALLLLATACSGPKYKVSEPQAGNTVPSTFVDQLEVYRSQPEQNLGRLRRLALQVLREGASSSEWQVRWVSLFGAGLSRDREALPILLDGLQARDPRIQLAALRTLDAWDEDVAEQALHRAMGSPYLPIRFEAAFHLARKRYPLALEQVEGLMAKLDKELLPLFPMLYGLIGSDAAQRGLRRLTGHLHLPVRLATVLATARFKRDDLLPDIRRLAMHVDIAQQEACAFALGELGDGDSVDRLDQLIKSSAPHVALAAHWALLQLGQTEHQKSIEYQALAGDPFAITLLGQLPQTKDILAGLCAHKDIQTRANAAIALVAHRDARALPALEELLISDSRDLALVQQQSPGHALQCWKVARSAQQSLNPYQQEFARRHLEILLIQAAEVGEQSFLKLANQILSTGQLSLIPLTVELLENRRTDAAIELLKLHQQRVGSALVRWTCNLALYRITGEAIYAENLRHWIRSQQKHSMIQFRPLTPIVDSEDTRPLTPDEVSQLLIRSYEAIALDQNEEGIQILVDAIIDGHPANRYALAGLLLRAVQ